ncbi:hypothetical protein PSH03_005386 [Micromonospora sp. PSH03]|uniref:hypothetical protein n=1 Tax=Micromonospora salmantinae TaxID=2911211 RepID=UPI001EE86315|nr:hypothetical protein [Micromonospora salmantinae]MCG5459603.1 hypothetical protein [Micromonospora salmantinae]
MKIIDGPDYPQSIGDTGVIVEARVSSVYPWRVEVGSNSGVYSTEELQKVTPVATEKPWEVGDRVKLTRIYNTLPVGTVGVVSRVDIDDNRQPVYVDFQGERYGMWPYADNIERVTTPDFPQVPSVNVSPDQLAEYVGAFISAAQSRVRGVGAEQYSTSEGQRFEGMTIPELIVMAREEAQDLAVYAAMVDIRLARMGEAFEAVKGAL